MKPEQNHSTPMFVLEGVAKSYPGIEVLSPLSLSIDKGEKVAIVGPSGSGKTTLLQLLGGVLQPDQGELFVAGRGLSGMSSGKELASLVGIIHQQFDLVPHLSVVHNVLAGRLGQWSLMRSLASLVSPRERGLALQALGKVGIAHKLYERTSRLSGGEQQRVAVARLLVQDPQAILADEPVASLDPARADDLLRLLCEIVEATDKTLVASLHYVGLVRTYFTRVVGLRNGELNFDVPVGGLREGMLQTLYDLKGLRGEVQTQVS